MIKIKIKQNKEVVARMEGEDALFLMQEVRHYISQYIRSGAVDVEIKARLEKGKL